MRILYLCQRVPFPPNKGEKLRTFHQIEYLTSQGYTVDVLALSETSQHDADCEALAEVINSAQCVRLGHKILRYVSGLCSGRPLSESNFYSAAMQKRLNEITSAHDYDAVIVSASSLYAYIAKSPKINTGTVRVLFDFMDVDSDKWRQYAASAAWPMSWLYSRESKLVQQLEAKATGLAERAFLIADKERELFASIHGKSLASKVSVLGNGIDKTMFYPITKEKQRVEQFLFVGVMDYKPNVDAMMWFVEYIWPSIKMRIPAAQLSIVGMHPTKEVIALGQQQDIQVTGRVDDVTPYFHSADVFIAPFQIARGVQNKILQAMACGIPVIGSSLGFEGIEIGNRVHGLVADNVEEYLFSLSVLDDKSENLAIRQNALNLINGKYSWAGQLKPLLDTVKPELKPERVCA